ncbi:uncharacterized protein K452DRAFT_291756 [Aplosporella prunicola CBS 121167]|uniref:Uncharacterized protein n=1 Tax=Aplosporella prunicola CBS 121167 TaxID=1176127 RepID=A0A6A6B0Y2_9PEZI|nr:uncharacterized protein K452DRAFT_291756 [Aplosporella prunicola CBS 121167]KAF2137218.1 hypothetical protein K452DRAFT_291756 [Aplosporella prunicola CBS 121167]
MTLASIIAPRWMAFSAEGHGAHAHPVHVSYGLHQRCDSVTGGCGAFPQHADCVGDNWSFCSMWRTVGFLISFAVIIEAAALIGYAVVLLGGKQKRDKGYKVISGLLALAAAVQIAGMAVVAFLYDHDERFFPPGWHLDNSWILCTVSWSVLVMTVCGLVGAAVVLPEEGDYELIPEGRM